MANAPASAPTSAEQGARFTATHWSVVLHAQDPASPQAGEALEKLCRSYWPPLYAYVRRVGNDEHTAKDLTQGFFAKLLEKNYLADVRREKGKFRSFLLKSLKHFLADEWDKSQAQKRGGGRIMLSFDEQTAEDRYRLEPADEMTPDKLFDRRWALTTLEQAVGRLRKEYQDTDKAALFGQLQDFLSGGPGDSTYAEAAARLGMTESTLKSYVFRLRKRNREILREVIAQTVASPSQIDEELRDLRAALAAT
ncbi:MAG TPA: sigma-70 family RNA polymerase sigma factor [Dongiaceae bacterium]|nr:sigma-70 family RNA polymerase sigma factor [Dongiaceae bacterium]